ncbi:MAG: hypothetical protein JWM16_3478 [Verrucomicrobiales bacterium]|nr:hypothetical protein [Verrucomicrobiales bacterium]
MLETGAGTWGLHNFNNLEPLEKTPEQPQNNPSSSQQPRLRDPETGKFISDPNNPASPYTFTDAQRRAAWRALAEDSNSPLTDAQRAEIEQRGWPGPQQINRRTGELETMEVSTNLFHCVRAEKIWCRAGQMTMQQLMHLGR